MIRRVTIDDVAVYREVRLRALADSPAAFGATYAAESALTDDEWRERVTKSADGADRTMALAFDGEDCIGLAATYDDDLGADVQLVSMWVAPSHRGTGIAADLVEFVLDWARASGKRTVGLWVTDANARAQRLYERLGFTLTGDVQPLPWNPDVDERRMVLAL